MLSSGGNPVAGQLAATTAAAALGSQTCLAVLVQNDPGNTVFNAGTGQCFAIQLDPRASGASRVLIGKINLTNNFLSREQDADTLRPGLALTLACFARG
jgi:hypothetical protein